MNDVNEQFPPVFETDNFLLARMRDRNFGRYRLSNGEVFTINEETVYEQIRQAAARCRTIYLLYHTA